ncbi:MAG: family 10 glycosylhydrolase [Mediterranea sp.]|jgi:uncharacterized lipoprotein YddW (UPF0748 family)|nr:family 10 glycosylhydrolase [Mediterranea sp.]
MPRFITFLLLLLSLPYSLDAQPKYEVRAAWISTAYGLDWPSHYALSATSIQRQKEELTTYLDQLQAAHFNTVLFQVRLRSDVLYPSAIEPFSSVLTGKAGRTPGYDPLAFAVAECHKRGMECHAWMVAIPLGSKKQVASLGKQSVVQRHKSLCVAYKNEYFLNPGQPRTKEYLFSLVKEVVSRYDVDGVQFDYLRYPEHATAFPDRKEFRHYGKGRNLEQWRRDNITDILRYIYKGIKTLKPWVKVTVCPVGKYNDTSRYPSRGWNAFATVHQDTKVWLAEGIVDQLYPMMYFQGNNFYPFVLDWQEQAGGRHIIPGLGIYFLHAQEGNWKLDEVVRQLHYLRHHRLPGEAFYRMKFLADDSQGIYTELAEHFYTQPALQPPMPWLDHIAPTPPTNLQVKKIAEGYTKLTWQPSADNDSLNTPMYVVYASDTYPVDTALPQNIVAQGVRDTSYIYSPSYPWQRKEYFAVTAVDRYGNESK